jgi:putative addiction module killer protein
MLKWTLEYWVDKTGKAAVENWFDCLEEDQLKAVIKELAMLELCGNGLKLPHSRSLGKGLFELRERRFGFRIYYCFQGKMVIILLQAGDKASQKNDIKVARRRLEEITKGL